jgi:hypothetical protein
VEPCRLSNYSHVPKKFAILTFCNNDYREIGEISTPNKKDYAAKHGYDLFIETEIIDSQKPLYWQRLLYIIKLMQNSSYEWIWHTDADSLIDNDTIRLEDIVGDTDKDLIIAQDNNGINAGQYLIRNCEWSIKFLQEADRRTEFMGHSWNDQEAMRNVLLNTEHLKHVYYIEKRKINSYGSVNALDYQPGDFIVHFPGSAHLGSRAAMIDLMKKYVQDIWDRKKKNKKRFGIITLADDNMRRVGDLSAQSKRHYAYKQGYEFIYKTELFDKTRDGSWNKIPWIQRVLPYYEWLLWSDADCIICNSDIRLEDILRNTNKDFVIGKDHQNYLNAGNFFIRNCPWSFDFLHRVYCKHDQGGFVNGRWQREKPYDEREQGVIQSFLEQRNDAIHSEIRWVRELGFSYRHNKLKTCPQGFPWSAPDTYVKGDFLKHYGGWWCNEAQRLTNMWDVTSGNSTFIP